MFFISPSNSAAQKRNFSIRITSVNVTKSAGNFVCHQLLIPFKSE